MTDLLQHGLLQGKVDGGSRRIVLIMADVTYMDSSGLGELIAAHTTLARVGGEMKLLNLNKRAHDLLKLTKLCTVFETFEDETSAGNASDERHCRAGRHAGMSLHTSSVIGLSRVTARSIFEFSSTQ